MTSEFSMDFRLDVFHPAAKPQAGQIAWRKDESMITVGVIPTVGAIPHPTLTGMIETVPITQREAAISRVVLAAVQSVLKQNEDRRTKLE